MITACHNFEKWILDVGLIFFWIFWLLEVSRDSYSSSAAHTSLLLTSTLSDFHCCERLRFQFLLGLVWHKRIVSCCWFSGKHHKRAHSRPLFCLTWLYFHPSWAPNVVIIGKRAKSWSSRAFSGAFWSAKTSDILLPTGPCPPIYWTTPTKQINSLFDIAAVVVTTTATFAKTTRAELIWGFYRKCNFIIHIMQVTK